MARPLRSVSYGVTVNSGGLPGTGAGSRGAADEAWPPASVSWKMTAWPAGIWPCGLRRYCRHDIASWDRRGWLGRRFGPHCRNGSTAAGRPVRRRSMTLLC